MAAPYEDEAISFVSGIGNPGDYWVSVAARRIESASTARGKQYELDTVQTGEYHATYDNRDGALTPGNTSGPYSPNVLPFRPIRKRMQYPATANVMHANQATAGEASTVGAFSAPVAPGNTVAHAYGGYGNPVVVASTTAYQGGQVFQNTVPASPSTGTPVCWFNGLTCTPGQQHTFSMYVRTPLGTGGLQVAATVGYVDIHTTTLVTYTGTAVTLPTASNTWTRVTVTAPAPPTNAAGVWCGVTVQNSPATATLVQYDGAQLEYAGAATSFVAPSTWYPIFTGFVERWPQRWDQNGLFRKVDVSCVDHFGYLSQLILKPPFYMDMLAVPGLRYFYPFDVGKLAGYVNDLSHQRGSALVVNSPYGAGSLTFGNSVSATYAPSAADTVAGTFVGGANAVATFNNPSSSTNYYETGTFIDLTTATGYVAPTGDSSGWYTRIIGFHTAAGYNPFLAGLWVWMNPGWQDVYTGGLIVSTGAGQVGVTASAYTQFGSANANDGNWHFAALRVNTTTGQLAGWLDGVDGGTATTYTNYVQMSPGNSDVVGGMVINGSNEVKFGFAGDVAFIAETAGYLSNTQLYNLYNSWQSAWRYDSSSSRFNRVLGWAGFSSKSNVSAYPGTIYMGPATDITAGGQAVSTYSPTVGTDAQTALNNIAVTENGNNFVSADGTITYQTRNARYGVQAPAIIFGENTSGGEIPYEGIAFDFDTTHIANDVQITMYQNNVVYEAFNPTSQAQYGTRTLTRTVNSFSANECTDAANWAAYRYGNADLRMQTLRIHVTGNPAAWGPMMTLECGQRSRVMRRDLQGTIQWDGWVEKISWNFDYKQNEVFVDLEISPADLDAVWLLSASHTTLQTAVNVLQYNSNGTFESGVSPWTANTGSVVQSATQVHSGTYSAAVTPDGTSSQSLISSEHVTVAAGYYYTVRCWVYPTQAVTNNFSLSVTWYNGGTLLSTSIVNVSLNAGVWQNVVNTFAAPAGATNCQIVPTLSGTPPAANVWYVDDIWITNSVSQVTINPFPNASTLPVAAYIQGNLTGGSGATVNCGGYTTNEAGSTMSYGGPVIRLGSGTGTFEDVPIVSYTTIGGTQVTNYAGQPVPGQYIGYTGVTLNLGASLANSYAAGAPCSEQLPAIGGANTNYQGILLGTPAVPFTDPTLHDSDSVVGTTTIIAY